MILLAWLLNRPGRVAAGFKMMLGTAAIGLAIASPVHIQSRPHLYLDLPAGRAAFSDSSLYDEYSWFLENTHPGEYFFGLPPLYSAFHMRNPSAVEGIHNSEYSRPEQLTALVASLEAHRVPLLVLRQWRDPLPAQDSSPSSDRLSPIRAYVSRNYRLTKTFPSGDDVWERIE